MLITTGIFARRNGVPVVGGSVQTAAATVLSDCSEPSPGWAIRYILCADSQARTLFLASSKMRS